MFISGIHVMYMHMCVCSCAHIGSICVCVCSCACAAKRPEKNLGCVLLCQPPVYYPLETDLLNPDLHWYPLNPKHLSFFAPVKHWSLNTGHNTLLFIWVLEIWTQVLPPGCTTNVHLHWTTSLYFQRWWCYYYYNSFHRTPLITAEGQGSGSATQKPPSPSLFKVIL